jgi:hypothetical protein
MTLRLLLTCMLAAIPACASEPQRLSGDARVDIVWNQVDDVHQLCEGLSGRKEFFQILGCSKWAEPTQRGGARVCNIYAPRPKDERDTQRFATLGHEVMHCFEGNWHDRWGKMVEPNRRLARAKPDSQAAAGGSGAALQENSDVQ